MKFVDFFRLSKFNMKNHRIRVIFTILSVVILATVILSFMIAVNLIKEYEQENLINEISEQGIRIYSDSNEANKICEILNNENLNYEIKKNFYYSYEFDIKPFKSTPYKIITRYKSIKKNLSKIDKNIYSTIDNEIECILDIWKFLIPLVYFLILVLLIICIGNIVTSIILTASEKSKFYGYLKILGLKKKYFYGIIMTESFFISLSGIIISLLACFAMKDLILKFVNTVNFSDIPKFYIKWYLPVILFSIILLATGFAAWKKVKKINNNDALDLLRGNNE